MRTNDTTQSVLVCCHCLSHDKTRYLRAHSWQAALEALWPHAYCAILRRPDGQFLAARLGEDVLTIDYCQGSTPEEARDAMRRDWQRMRAYEEPRRCLEPARKLLEARGISIDERWAGVVGEIATCDTAEGHRKVMRRFLRQVAPMLPERDSALIMRRLEQLPHTAKPRARAA